MHLHTVLPWLLCLTQVPRFFPPQILPIASFRHFMAQSLPLKPSLHKHLPPLEPPGTHFPCPKQMRPLLSLGQVTLHLSPRYPLVHLQNVTFFTSSYKHLPCPLHTPFFDDPGHRASHDFPRQGPRHLQLACPNLSTLHLPFLLQTC